MTGFNVEIEALEGYGDNLKSFKDQANTFEELTGRADVGDESWGVVGIMTKGKYDEALGELKSLLTELKTGLDTTSEKVSTAAKAYRANDDQHVVTLGDYEGQLTATDTPRV